MKRILACMLCFAMLCGCSGKNDAEQQSYTTLTLGVWYDSYEVQTLVEQFNASHTDYQIAVEVYYNENTGVDAALDRMNTQIATGDTPDILYLNSMDVAALKNANVLLDLTPLMEADPKFHQEDYFMNIWELFRENGKLYEFVPCFELGGICGPASVLGDRTGWTISEYQDFVAAWTLERPILRSDREQMLSYMIQFSTDAYLNVSQHSCAFQTDGFSRWLEFVKSLPEEKPQNAVMWSGWVNSFAHVVQLEEEYGQPLKIVGFPEEYGGGPCAMSLCSFGISSTTEYAEICWAFLMSTLEESVQLELWNGLMLGFPMDRSSLETLIQAAISMEQDEDGVMAQELSEETADYLPQLIASIDRLRLRHQSILDIITEEVQAYFQDDTTAAHCAEMVQNRVSIYLSEQQ